MPQYDSAEEDEEDSEDLSGAEDLSDNEGHLGSGNSSSHSQQPLSDDEQSEDGEEEDDEAAEDEQADDSAPDRSGTAAWYRSRQHQPVSPSASLTVLQYCYVLLNLKRRHRARNNLCSELIYLLARCVLPAGNIAPPSWYLVRKVIGCAAAGWFTNIATVFLLIVLLI